MKKKNLIKKIIFILVVSLLSISAFLINKEVQTSTNTISVGTIDIKFENQQKEIEIKGNEAIPMTNEFAVNNLEGYSFDLTNKGDMSLVYSVSVKIDENSFDSSVINIDSDPSNDEAERLSIPDGIVIYTGTLKAKETKHYSDLRFYINEQMDRKDLDNKAIKFHLVVNATTLNYSTKSEDRNIEEISSSMDILSLAYRTGRIEYQSDSLDNGLLPVIALVVNSDGVNAFVSGNILIDGKDWQSGNGHNRISTFLKENNLDSLALQANDNYAFYTIFLYSDGTFRVGCGSNDDSSEYRADTFETHSKYWKTAEQSIIEKELYS